MEVRMAPPWLSEHTEEVGIFFMMDGSLTSLPFVGNGRVGI